MTELEKMHAGLLYDANYDPKLIELRTECADLCIEYSTTLVSNPARYEILKKLLGIQELPEGLDIRPPFTADYGNLIHLGQRVFINASCYLMDGGGITIGNDVFIGPYCGFYTANHPLNYTQRNQGLEIAKPIVVGNNCWFGANVSVMPGVTIGSGCVIAAGSVVSKDLPDNALAGGVPAKVIRFIDQNERQN